MSETPDADVRSPQPEPGPFGSSHCHIGTAHVIRLTGELDRDAATDLQRWLTSITGSSTAATIVLDLSDLSFIDAGCIRVILTVCHDATSRGRHVVVDGLHGVPERVFHTLGLMPMFERRVETSDDVGDGPSTVGDGQGASHSDASTPERKRRADLWEARADRRERLADEREQLADDRESLADERERMADRHEQVLIRRESEWARRSTPTGEADDREQADRVDLAVRRAEAALLRADADLERTRRAAVRVNAQAAARVARAERSAVARADGQIVDAEEAAWAADRRDFVAAQRDVLAGERDRIADERDKIAGQRERLADERERDMLTEERGLAQPTPAGGQTPDADQDPGGHAKASPARTHRGRRATDDRGRPAGTSGPAAYGPMLLSSFASLARQLFDNDDLASALARVLKFTVETVSGCDGASVTLVRRGRIVHAVTSGADTAELDELQFSTGIGPAPEAMYGEDPVYVPDLPGAQRWPVLAATAEQLGVRSALCFGLYVNRRAQWSALGTFTLYATTPDAFSDDDYDFGCVLSAYVAVAVTTAHRQDEVDRREAALHRALSTRDIIGQAKGILMERQRLSAGEAFDHLRRVSQRLNRKLAEVAEELAETGEIPT